MGKLKEKKEIGIIDWWNSLTFEEKFYKTIEANSVIDGDKTRHPDSLAVYEIREIYNYHLKSKDHEGTDN